MKNHKKEAQGIRKKQKTYSKYFRWIWTMLIPITLVLILTTLLAIKIKIEITQLWDAVNNESYRTDRLEKIHEN